MSLPSDDSNKPRKPAGEIGPTRISFGEAENEVQAEIISAHLPQSKEALEEKFAKIFVEKFNLEHPLGPEVEIAELLQNDTSDLDFRIESSAARFLELAELNPRSEPFGRTAYRTGRLATNEYARWIYRKLVERKAAAYGRELAQHVILLLYVTHWQFLPSENLIACVRALAFRRNCTFRAVFVLRTDGSDLRLLDLVHPWPEAKDLPAPSSYKSVYTNLPPGNHSWVLDTDPGGG